MIDVQYHLPNLHCVITFGIDLSIIFANVCEDDLPLLCIKYSLDNENKIQQ